MKSIAIWHKSADGSTQQRDIELHFNLWKLPKGTGHVRFLDVGLLINTPSDIKELSIYFPFRVNRSNFKDIVSLFITNSSLVSAIFNENYTVSSNSETKFFSISNTKGDDIFDIYQADEDNIKQEEKFNGSIFTLSIPKTSRPVYFRFRIDGDYLKTLSKVQKVPNAVIQSAFSQAEMIDFRVNEARDLNKGLLEEIRKQSTFHIAKCHFFFVCSYYEDILGAHKAYDRCRNLENYRWSSYVGNDELKDQTFIAYHWKDFNKNDINILIKTKFEKNNGYTILKYLIVLLIITVSFSIISSFAYDWIKPFTK